MNKQLKLFDLNKLCSKTGKDAGQQLGIALEKYKGTDCGGAGDTEGRSRGWFYAAAQHLRMPLSVNRRQKLRFLIIPRLASAQSQRMKHLPYQAFFRNRYRQK